MSACITRTHTFSDSVFFPRLLNKERRQKREVKEAKDLQASAVFSLLLSSRWKREYKSFTRALLTEPTYLFFFILVAQCVRTFWYWRIHFVLCRHTYVMITYFLSTCIHTLSFVKEAFCACAEVRIWNAIAMSNGLFSSLSFLELQWNSLLFISSLLLITSGYKPKQKIHKCI